MTKQVKNHIRKYCTKCRCYECNDGAEQWNIDEMTEDDGHYCSALRRYINGGTVKQCFYEMYYPYDD